MQKSYEKKTVCWVMALKSEANPIINALNLKRVPGHLPFQVYKEEEEGHWLVISGIGAINSAAACSFLFEKSKADSLSIWVNLGIAGSKNFDIGDLVLIDKVSSSFLGKSQYPRIAPNLESQPKSELLTVQIAEINYETDAVYDMEGFAFFLIANKFTTLELILVLKVISDGPGTDLEKIDKNKVSELIESKITTISDILSSMNRLSKDLKSQEVDPKEFVEICKNKRYSFSEKVILKKLMQQWYARNPSNNSSKLISKKKDGAEVIKFLEAELNGNK
jgi:nucleoside phosphorylase